jgi:hypothetical protein
MAPPRDQRTGAILVPLAADRGGERLIEASARHSKSAPAPSRLEIWSVLCHDTKTHRKRSQYPSRCRILADTMAGMTQQIRARPSSGSLSGRMIRLPVRKAIAILARLFCGSMPRSTGWGASSRLSKPRWRAAT